MIRYSRIQFEGDQLFLDGSWQTSGISPITGINNETTEIHNTSDNTENGSYDENDIITTINAGDEATLLNSEFNLNVEGFLKNIVLDKIPPELLNDNSTYAGINSYLISLNLFEKYGISYRTIKISYCPDIIVNPDTSTYIAIYDGPSTKELSNKYGEFLNNLKIEKNTNNYNLSFLLESTIGHISQNGLKIEIYDYAGNGLIYFNDNSFFTVKKIDFIPVEISFSNIEPPNMFVTPTEIGKCKVSVYNPEYNNSLWGSRIVARLLSDSVRSNYNFYYATIKITFG